MENVVKVGKDHASGSLLLGSNVSRGFMVRMAKRGAKRGGMGAVRVRESYLRTDRLLFSVSDSLLGGSSAAPDTEGHCYICPTAEFLHCYLELFDRPEIVACFGASGSGEPSGACRLLLLHSELAKLTGAAGALSIRQERQLVQLSRNLRGTLVFFDQFCPDLHRSQGGISTPGSRTGVSPANRALLPIVAACSWCRARLGNALMAVLTDEGGGMCRPGLGDLLRAVEPSGDLFDGVRALDLDGFLRDFIGGEAGDELSKRGDLLRRAYSTIQQAPVVGAEGAKGGREGTPLRLAMPHPSRAQLDAMIASSEAFRGKLDVFEHNPGEGVVVVSGGEGSSEQLEDWADAGGRTQVLVVGKAGMNRSIHGDTVAVTLLPRRRWRAPADRKRLTHVNDEDSGDGVEGANAGLLDEDTEGSRGGDVAPPGAMPTGFVVGILEEGRRPYVVTIPPEEIPGAGPGGGAMATVTAVPMDPRVPKIRIKTRQLAQISGQRLVAAMDGWDIGHVFPFGHYVTSLGPVGEVASEAAALLVECQASFEPFSFNALASLPSVPSPPRESQEPRDALLPPPSLAEREKPEDGFGRAPRWQDSGWRVQDADVVGRRDLREERAMSVDPPGCQDIDDAMHVTRKPNGKLQIGVHIADVTRFLDADGPLDKEARVRATTVYLVHRRIDMLPALLSSDLCSLHAGRDRLSVSVVWEAEEAGEDIRLCTGAGGSSPECWFGRTAIHSKASMTYDQAESLVEKGKIVKPRGHQEPPPGQAGRDVDDALQPGLAEDLRLLTRFARTMRKKRTKNGAVDLSQAGAELKFKIDPATGAPLAVSGKEESEIHHTVAELMILANSTVAERIRRSFPSVALLRVHSPPDPSRLTAFEGVAAKVGVQSAAVGVEARRSGKGLSESLATVEGGGLKGERGKADLLKSLAVRAMSEAEYVSTGSISRHGTQDLGDDRFGHFGLGLSNYTHFTSPIRRYADIVVHRLLLASIGATKAADAAVATSARRGTWGNRRPASPGDTKALPSSSAPSVIEMEQAAVGREVMKRTAAGDASFVINPDGTRTYNKVSMAAAPSAAALKHDGAGSTAVPLPSRPTAPRPPPGFETSPDTAIDPLCGGEGDDLLDALLGLEVADTPSTSFKGGAVMAIGTRAKARQLAKGGADHTRFSGQSVKEEESIDRDRSRLEEDGDSALDAILGLDLAVEEVPPTKGGKSWDLEPDGEASRRNDTNLLGDGGALTREGLVTADAGRESEGGAVGEGAVVELSPPFGGAELGRLCKHLNDSNRRAKQLAQRCQEMFLSLFFKDHCEIVQGLVLSLRANGFIAYVPAFDAKGPVYLSDVDGQVQVDPALLGLPATSGTPSSKAFTALAACRAIPSASISLVTPKSDSPNAFRSTGVARAVNNEEQEVLEVRPPPGSGGKVLRLGVLDTVSLRLSCDVRPTQARLPKVRFHLAGVGKQPESMGDRELGESRPKAEQVCPENVRQFRGEETGDLRSSRGIDQPPVAKGVRCLKDGGKGVEVKRASARPDQRTEGRGLYWMLQGALDDAILTDLSPTPGAACGGHSMQATAHVDGQATEIEAGGRRRRGDPVAGVGTFSNPDGGGRRRRKGNRQESGVRSEVGAGRALFGGFVPSRQAPAASLYNFGDNGDRPDGGTATLGSIYQGGTAKSPASGTVDSLDEARVRQYTQEATARLQRLGAEKRNSRISRSKRQG